MDAISTPGAAGSSKPSQGGGRVGVVDVGSNSVRMVVFDGASRSPAYFFNEKAACHLGKGLAETGKLNPKGCALALSALGRFARLAQEMEAAPLSVVATAAVRAASDGAAFRAQVLKETGLEMRVIAGGEEARLAAQGVLLGRPGARGIVCDIGGSSMELAALGGGEVGLCRSTPLGPFYLQQMGAPERRQAEISRILSAACKEIGAGEGARLFLVGGSWRAIARLDMVRRGYPLSVLHEYRMAPADLLETLEWIATHEPGSLLAQSEVSAARMELIPWVSEALRAVLERLRPSEVEISSFGIREGLFYDQMPQKMRQSDPLIEAARALEMAHARFPGAGARLFDFLSPLFSGAQSTDLRLIRAGCLLHDVNWRLHPDYRAEASFDYVIRANLSGLDHGERVLLAKALRHRYKRAPIKADRKPFLALLGADEARLAKVLGRGMRLGAMLAAGDPSVVGHLVWSEGQKALDLVVRQSAAPLIGEAVYKRLEALGEALGARANVRMGGGGD